MTAARIDGPATSRRFAHRVFARDATLLHCIVSAFLLCAVPSALAAQSAIPRVIVIWGDTLRGRVLLVRAAENVRIVEGLATRAPASVAAIAGRPFFEVAIFLPGPAVDGLMRDSAALARLDVSRAALRARLYSPVDGRETLFAFEDPADGGLDIRLVGIAALRVFRSYGLVLRSVE
jgi:hypothetical protein